MATIYTLMLIPFLSIYSANITEVIMCKVIESSIIYNKHKNIETTGKMLNKLCFWVCEPLGRKNDY